MMQKYNLEFILHVQDATLAAVKSSLSEFGDSLEISDSSLESESRGRAFKVQINTEEPTIVFDVCSQFGRIKSVKINEGAD